MEETLLDVHDSMPMYWVAMPTMHLCGLAQYADTLMELCGILSSSLARTESRDSLAAVASATDIESETERFLHTAQYVICHSVPSGNLVGSRIVEYWD